MLRRHDVHTLFVDEHGVESEKSLNALLDMTETEDIFGAGMVMEMKAMLVVQGGPNLRNDVAHGLLDDNSAWSDPGALHVVVLPSARDVAGHRDDGPRSDAGSGVRRRLNSNRRADTEPAAQPTADIEAGALAEDQHPDE